jgi:D-alanyl-D-alanine carboxypeptidase/D-alanyl-D-alanine-endopeptidase (penicillin-binding protein 4)
MRVRRQPAEPAGGRGSLAPVLGRSPNTRRAAPLLAALTAALAALPAAAAASPQSDLQKSLERSMRSAGSSGAYVHDLDTGQRLFSWNPANRRVLASNTKLFTIGATLATQGIGGKLATTAMTGHALDGKGVLDGNLYMVGGGDPAFGDRSYVRAKYGSDDDATVEQLAKRLYDAGLREVRGRVVGDESLYDSRRSGPAEGYRASADVGGPLGALVYDHGRDSSGHFQTNPPEYAAARLTDALRNRGVTVRKSARAGTAPSGALELARVESLRMSRLAELTGKPSDNFFAELFAKGIGGGTTAGGAKAIVRFAKQRGVTVRLSDGSGLSHSNQAAPQAVVRYLVKERTEPEANALFGALPIAGVDGTLAQRMTSGPAYRHCRAKTGTLRGVSALSGYCRTRGGHTLFFSILMNGQGSDSYAHSLQDRMAQAIAGYAG